MLRIIGNSWIKQPKQLPRCLIAREKTLFPSSHLEA